MVSWCVGEVEVERGYSHTLYKGRKVVPKDPLQHPLGSPRAMSRHISHSTLHEITLTGNGADSVRHRGVQTAYACARALKSCLSCRESALRRSYARTPRQAFYSHSCTILGDGEDS